MESWTLKFDETLENVIKDIGVKHWHYIYTKPKMFKEELLASLLDDNYADTLRFLNMIIDKKASKDIASVRNCAKSYICLEFASIALRISGETFINSDLIIQGLCMLLSGLGKSINVAEVGNVINKIDSHLPKENGIDKIVDGARNSALILAAKKGDIAEVKSLLSRGANIHSEDNVRRTALSGACCGGYDEIVKLLIDEGSEIQFENFSEHGWSSLTHAANNCSDKCLTLLIEAGADIEFKTKFGQTPLIIAAIRDTACCVKILLEAGADINYKDRLGNTALSEAIRMKNTEIVDILKTAGAK